MSDAGAEIDHYAILGLPSDEHSSKISLEEIKKAYREQSRLRHPDKRPDDPNATADFQQLNKSFKFLNDAVSRAEFDARIRARRDRVVRDSALSEKRRKLAKDLDARERAAEEEGGEERKAEMREKLAKERLKAEIDAMRARAATRNFSEDSRERKEDGDQGSESRERTLKVSWERVLGDYSAAKLREIFEKYGEVEDVVIRALKKKSSKGSAIVVMALKDAAVAAARTVSGDLSNPLLVLPLLAASSNAPYAYGSAETVETKLNNVVGTSFKDREASILEKLQKRAAEQRKNMQDGQVS